VAENFFSDASVKKNNFFSSLSATKSVQQSAESVGENILYRTQSPKKLLGTESHCGMIRQIKNLVLNEEEFTVLYKPLLEQFANFVQRLPSLEGEKSDILMLNIGIQRAFAVLQQLDALQAEDKDPLFRFAAFSAILLRDIGTVTFSREVLCCDAQGLIQALWAPYQGPMVLGQHYRVRYTLPGSKHVVRLHAIAYALSIMPLKGVAWLQQENALLYEMWLAYLSGQESVWGDFGVLLERAVKKVGLLSELDTVPQELTQEQHHELMFIAWLRAQIASKRLKVNKKGAPIHLLKKGIWIADSVIKKFAKARKGNAKQASFGITFRIAHNHLGVACYGERDLAYRRLHGKLKTFSGASGGIYLANKGILGKAIAGAGVSGVGAVPEKSSFSAYLAQSNKDAAKKAAVKSTLFK
jgi:hypothetical protein